MTAELRDLRASIAVTTDQVLDAVALATGVTKQEVVRDVLGRWADGKIHEAKLIARFAPRDGKAGSGPE